MFFFKRIEVLKLMGFPIRVDVSWFFVFFLIILSLASGFFPHVYPGLTEGSYWAMAFVGSIGLFLSIIFHEFFHSLVAKYYGVKIDGITLFIFGGVAEMKKEMPSAKAEFLVAIAGPLSSFLLAIFFLTLSYFWNQSLLPDTFVPLFTYLGWVNALLAIFNCIPAFPMDGGRVLRSIIWALNKNFIKSSLIAAKIGELISWLMIGWGVLNAFMGNITEGLWLLLIGFFIRRASRMSYSQAKLQKKLSKYPVLGILEKSELSFAPEDSLFKLKQELQNRLVQTHYPIVENQKLKGIFSIKKFEKMLSSDDDFIHLMDFSEKDFQDFVLNEKANAWDAFLTMRQNQATQAFIVGDEESFLGAITMARLLLLVQQDSIFS